MEVQSQVDYQMDDRPARIGEDALISLSWRSGSRSRACITGFHRSRRRSAGAKPVGASWTAVHGVPGRSCPDRQSRAPCVSSACRTVADRLVSFGCNHLSSPVHSRELATLPFFCCISFITFGRLLPCHPVFCDCGLAVVRGQRLGGVVCHQTSVLGFTLTRLEAYGGVVQ